MNKKNAQSRRDLFKTAGALAVGVVTAGLLTADKANAANEKIPRWAMVIDVRRCVGCFSCQVSCKMENGFPMWNYGAWVLTLDKGEYPNSHRVFLPKLCNHCEGNEEDKVPPCVKACPEYPKDRREFTMPDGKKATYRYGATYKRPDGLILVDNALCTGCGKCLDKCPYGARSFDRRVAAGKDATKHGVTKCNFCQPRIDAGLEPACVRNCVGKARIFGDLNDPNSEVSKLVANNQVKFLKSEEKTKPNVPYIALDDDIAKMEDNTNPKPVLPKEQ